LIIVAPTEHRVRIEVGYGLEGELTDAQSRVIVERYMKPDFKKGDFDAGVLAGTKAVLATLGNTDFTAPDYSGTAGQDDGDNPGIGWIIFVIILLVIFRGGFWPLLFLGGLGGGRGGWGGGGWSSGGGGGGFSGGGGSFGGGGASGSW
jgi:uncharacterized protein